MPSYLINSNEHEQSGVARLKHCESRFFRFKRFVCKSHGEGASRGLGIGGVDGRARERRVSNACVCSAWVPCVALPSGGGSSVGPSPLCGSPVGGVPRPVVSAFHVASTRVMSNARTHAPA